jgi:tape measure domain-containing protein
MIRGLDYYINLHDRSFTRNITRAQAQTARLDSMFAGLSTRVAGVFGAYQAAAFIKSSTDTFAQLEALDVRLKTVHSTTSGYVQANRSLNDIITRLKLPIIETTEGYTRMAAATQGTNLEGQKTIDIFRGISTAGRALKLDPVMGNIFLSLEQMLSKGTVMSQELRLQLGNALPGVFQRAAAAMGMTQKQFSKQMELGNIKSADFVPKFAAYLEEYYKDKIPAALQAVQAKMTESNNAIIRKTAEIGEKAAPVYLKFLEVKLKLLGIVERLMPLLERFTNFYERHFDTINRIVGVLALLWLRTKALNIVSMLWAGTLRTIGPIYTTMSRISAVSMLSQTKGIALWKSFALSSIGLVAKRIAILGIAWELISHTPEQWTKYFKSMLVDLKAIGFWIKAITTLDTKAMDKAMEYGKDFGHVRPDNMLLTDAQKKAASKASRNVTFDEFNVADSKGRYYDSIAKKFVKRADEGGSGSGSGTDTEPVTVSAGRSVRNISVVVNNKIEVTTTTIKEAGIQVARTLQDQLNRAVLDFEAAL